MAQVQLSILKITDDTNDYVITDETARQTANNAQSTAETAQSTANNAQSTAETAQSTAETAQLTANSKLKTVTLLSSYENDTKTLTLNLQKSTN